MTDLDTSKLIALKLSSLNKNDFDWVFSQLDQDIKNDLTPLLNEIKSIGLDVKSSDINALIKNSSSHNQSRYLDKNIQLINNSTYEEVVELFKYESPILFNTLIDIEKWDWAENQKYVDLPKTSTAKVIKNIKSKKLLENSIISTTATILRNREGNTSSSNKISQFELIEFITAYLNRVLRLIKKWKF